jgi:hypothetical protein
LQRKICIRKNIPVPEILKKSLELAEMLKVLEKRNGDLIDMSSLALKNYKEEQEQKKETTENK